MKNFSATPYLVSVCFIHHRITFCRNFFNKNKNETTPKCSLFKLIASSSANIFLNTEQFRTMNVMQYTLSLHCLCFVYHYLFFFAFLLRTLVNLPIQICRCGSSVVAIVSVAYFSIVKFVGFHTDASYGWVCHSSDWLATWVTSSKYSILHACDVKRFLLFFGGGGRGIVGTREKIYCTFSSWVHSTHSVLLMTIYCGLFSIYWTSASTQSVYHKSPTIIVNNIERVERAGFRKFSRTPNFLYYFSNVEKFFRHRVIYTEFPYWKIFSALNFLY